MLEGIARVSQAFWARAQPSALVGLALTDPVQ